MTEQEKETLARENAERLKVMEHKNIYSVSAYKGKVRFTTEHGEEFELDCDAPITVKRMCLLDPW